MDFIVDRKRYTATKQGVEARMRGVGPDSIYQYSVEVNGVRYPVKQVFRVVTGLDLFTTNQARSVLRRLGFTIQGPANVTASLLAAATEPPPVTVLEIQTLAGGVHEFELDQDEDVQALESQILHSIGSEGAYQGRTRRADAVEGTSMLTIAWQHVAAASLYRRSA
jgi:hypothetical protein